METAPHGMPEAVSCPRCGQDMRYGRSQGIGRHYACAGCRLTFKVRPTGRGKRHLPTFHRDDVSIEERKIIMRQWHEHRRNQNLAEGCKMHEACPHSMQQRPRGPKAAVGRIAETYHRVTKR